MAKNEYIKITTPPFTMSFPTLLEPKPDMKGNPPLKYSIKMMFPKDISGKDLEKFNEMKAQIAKVARDTFVNKEGKLPRNLKNPIADGDDSDSEHSHGFWTANARTQRKPGVVDQSCRLLSDAEIAEKIYGGCICRATLLIGTFDLPESKGINLFLQNVQLLGEGTRIGGSSRDASSDFEATEKPIASSDFDSPF
jgi:hypothetical protein